MSGFPTFPTFGGGSISGPVSVNTGTTATGQAQNDQTTIDEINKELNALNDNYGLSGHYGTAPASTPATPAKSNTFSTIMGDGSLLSSLDILGRAGKAVDDTLGTGSASLDKFFGLSISRFVAVILGLIFIAGGIYLFKPAQQIINKTIKTGSVL